MDGRRPEMRRTMTLSEQLSTPDPAIRDFLKIPHDADVGGSPQDGDNPSAVDAQGGRGGTSGWKPLRDRLRLRRAAGAWQRPKPGTASAHAPTNSGDLSNMSSANNRSNKYNHNPGEAAAAFSRTYSRAPSLRATPTFSRAASTRVGPASSRSSSRCPATSDFRDVEERRHDGDGDDGEEEDDDDEEDEDEEEEKEEAPAAQMSLMALLEQTDSNWDDEDEEEESGGGGARKKGGGAEGDDDEDDGEGREEEMVHVCCVCMVRHKGAAFIPCGHTFCRLCSRELWVSRGNCPLCNGFIQEILDIF